MKASKKARWGRLDAVALGWLAASSARQAEIQPTESAEDPIPGATTGHGTAELCWNSMEQQLTHHQRPSQLHTSREQETREGPEGQPYPRANRKTAVSQLSKGP